jgi:restriction system protein
MLPKQKQIEVPLLQVLVEIGGQGRPKEIYPLVAKKFPDIREEELAETLSSGGNRWTNRTQWARQTLVEKGEMDSPAHGVWRITEKGRQRLGELGEVDRLEAPSTPTFVELIDDYQVSFRSQLLERLHSLSPREFEQFARKLLGAYGFQNVRVTQLSNDGGIDGYGKLRVGLAMMNVAFQCKRWQGNVGRPEVDRFRGAITGEYEQGVFFTTSDFTAAARDASIRRGAVPIILLNGQSIVDLMIEKELGVRCEPLYLYYERPDDLTETEEE